MRHDKHPKHLQPLSTLDDWKLEHRDQDIRGWELYDRPGHSIGVIDDLLADERSERVEAVRLKGGEQVPVERILIGDDAVYLKDMSLRTPVVMVYEHR